MVKISLQWMKSVQQNGACLNLQLSEKRSNSEWHFHVTINATRFSHAFLSYYSQSRMAFF